MTLEQLNDIFSLCEVGPITGSECRLNSDDSGEVHLRFGARPEAREEAERAAAKPAGKKTT